MRRVVVTPTFAAGLGVVVAALLAYPMQTVFSYVGPGALPPGGVVCGPHGCEHQDAPGGQSGPLGGAVPNPAQSGSASSDDHDPAPAASGQPSASSGSSGGTSVAQPQLSYRITNRWQGGFQGQVTVKFTGTVPATWRLRFGYPGGHITSMTPASTLQADGHGVMVRSSDYAASPGPVRHVFAIGVSVDGKPARPARCAFDGQACHIG